jgi:hypothetical protein
MTHPHPRIQRGTEMSVQQLVVGVSERVLWGANPGVPSTEGHVSLGETCHLLLVLALLLCVTLALLTSTTLIDVVLQMVAGIS